VDDRRSGRLSSTWRLALAKVQISAVGANKRQPRLWLRVHATKSRSGDTPSTRNHEGPSEPLEACRQDRSSKKWKFN